MRKGRPTAKRVSESALITYRLMMPTDANIAGNVFGGSIMKYMDEIAGIVAFRHAGMNVVTASIDRMNFYAPVYIGDLLILKASVNYVGRTSMEVGVRIEAQDPRSGRSVRAGSCYLTYVALNSKGRPTPVPKLFPQTAEEKLRFRQASIRRRLRDEERAAIEKL
jgi:acyl-CoA hydrolase